MTTTLDPMDAARLSAWHERSTADYIESRVASGETREQATAAAALTDAELFPGGEPADGQHVFDVVSDGENVGILWIGLRDAATNAWWVYDVEIDEAFRGHGHGRTAMLLAEQKAKELGAATLGLNVFGFNTVARGLYESLGYEPTAIQMRKPLP
ncbi:hypothetical protein AX769_07965 [Frondihabitans sp. PAMC 28766]|uniref:GNAT family N-acetyltransferase n=1 Tax=Frondihabitans sp. PAMC 28766 TaxID=1795630 RepID=UPI00078DF218|nr:GNAT family N-acetyltransferase [Frondihabitans sp. PAMC 28766]AMM20112.1 hypothetical protein AX769_07965 [Frondihabitans sp. PAMC 28766]